MTDSPVTKVPPTYTKLHFDDSRSTTYITCSSEAAKYAYKHFPDPYSVEWRAASAGYDAGREFAAGVIADEMTKYEAEYAACAVCAEDATCKICGYPDGTHVNLTCPNWERKSHFEGPLGTKQAIKMVQSAPVLNRTPADIAEWETLAVGDTEQDSPAPKRPL